MAAPTDDEAYDIGEGEAAAEIPAEWQSAAIYTLERPARCSHCREPIRTLHIVRLSRTQVSFTSSLPRGGRALLCPNCSCIIAAELSVI
jgi:hypothetical protein